MQQLEDVECGFGKVIDGDQPKASEERLLDHTLFLENIGEGPIGHHVDFAVAFPDGVGQPGAHVNRIRDLRFAHVCSVELAPDERDVGTGGGGDLAMYFVDGGGNHLVRRNGLGMAKDIHRGVVSIGMGGDKVERHPVFVGVRYEGVDPCGLRCRRAAYPKPRTDRFERAGGIVVKLEVGLLRRTAGPEVDVWFVPNLEIPTGHLIDAVAIDQVLSKGLDQCVPLGVIRQAAKRWGDTRRDGNPGEPLAAWA